MRLNALSLYILLLAACCVFVAAARGQEDISPADWIRPAALRPGDTIGFVAPRGAGEVGAGS